MSANFENKKVIVAEINEKLKSAKSVVLVDYIGINVEEVTQLRKECREAGVEYKIYKNNLFKRATEGTDFEEINKDLVGPNAFVFSYEDATSSARVLKKFAKNSKSLELKSGIVDGVYYDLEGIEKIADIPSREVLLSKIMGSLKSPMSKFAYLLKAMTEKLESGEELVSDKSSEQASASETSNEIVEENSPNEETVAEESAE